MLGVLCKNTSSATSSSSSCHDNDIVGGDNCIEATDEQHFISSQNDKSNRRKQNRPNRLVLPSKMITAVNIDDPPPFSSSVIQRYSQCTAVSDGTLSDPGGNDSYNNNGSTGYYANEIECNRTCSSAPCSTAQKNMPPHRYARNQRNATVNNLFHSNIENIEDDEENVDNQVVDEVENQSAGLQNNIISEYCDEFIRLSPQSARESIVKQERATDFLRNKRKRGLTRFKEGRQCLDTFINHSEENTGSVLDLTSNVNRYTSQVKFQENLSDDSLYGNDKYRSLADEEYSDNAEQVGRYTCSLCGCNLLSPAALRFHMSREHGIISPIDQVAGIVNQQYDCTQFSLNEEGDIARQNQHATSDMFGEQEEQGKNCEESSSQEDYCDICQKHFCNKYYLRKHKADVHGIYTDYVRPSKILANSTKVSTSKSSSTPISKSPSVGSPTSQMTDVSNGIIMMNPYFGHLLNPQMIGKQTSFPGEKYIQSIFQPRTDVPSEDLLDCHEQNAQSSASCPVCKKEFCNEEYLRLHMVNRHSDHFFAREFTTEHGDESMDEDDKDQQNDDPSKESDRDDEISMHMQYQNENNMFCSTNEDQKLDDNFENESSFTSEQCSGEQRSEDAAVKIEKLQNSKNKMYSFRDHFLPFANNTSDCDHFKVDSKFFLPNSEDSSALQNSLDERLFASTVSNSSSQILFSKNYQHISTSSIDGGNSIGAKLSERVVCDICNKQVCNKYFLKTHKSRVHGINSEKVNESQIYSSSLDQQKISYKQRLTNSCSPSFNNDCHDGIEGGGGGNDNSSQDSSQEDLQQLDLSIQNSMSEQERNDLLKNNIDPEAYCTICKKEFCSKYFLRTHQQNIHKVKQTLIVNTTPKKVRCSSKDSITTKVKSLSPAQTRVTCSICNKELCNKYFLRSHMMNVHNIMGEEQRRECEDNRLNPLIKSERIEYSQMMPDYQRIPSVNIYDESSLNSLSLFKCPICGECLNSQNECSEHSRKVHGVTAGAALVAKRSFNNISNSDQSSDLCPPSKSKEGRLDFPGFSGMQPFIFESDDSRFSEHFVPCMVYLPIKSRVHNTVSFNLRLKPVGHENIFQNHR